MEQVETSTDPVAERCPWVLRHPLRSPGSRAAHDRVARLRDLVLLGVTLPLSLTVLLLVALVVKLEHPRAPVFFRQRRTGRHGHRFDVLKFRTMVPNAEELKHDLRHLNELEWPDFKITEDPRVTSIGKFLRATGLDELPQLLAVARGEMSLVGPRPTSFASDTYATWQTERLEAPPGVTGLWQVAGRTETMFDDRVRIEIAYVRRRSMLLDVVILLQTIPAMLRREGK